MPSPEGRSRKWSSLGWTTGIVVSPYFARVYGDSVQEWSRSGPAQKIVVSPYFTRVYVNKSPSGPDFSYKLVLRRWRRKGNYFPKRER
jgi:hypothetical protein